MPSTPLATILTVLGYLGALAAGIGYLSAAYRKANIEALKQTSEGWKAAAELKSQHVLDLKEQVDELRTELKTLQQEHKDVLALNVRLQNREAQWDVDRERWAREREQLERRIGELERRLKEGS